MTMPEKLSRRLLLKSLAGAAAAGMVPTPMWGLFFSQGDQPTGMQRGEMGRLVAAFKRSFNVPALSVAISRNGQFVFDQGFGFDQGFRQGNSKDLGPTDMSSLFRIASLTKPITAVTIFTLIEQGKLNLTDKVFGTSGILGTKYGKAPYKQYVTDITVDHLDLRGGLQSSGTLCLSTHKLDGSHHI